MRRNDKIVNSSPAKNEQGAVLRNAYSGRDAPSRLGPRLVDSTPRSSRGGSTSRRAALVMSPMKPARSNGDFGGGTSSRGGAPQSSARGVGKKEAQSWMSEQGSWAERAWAS